jgi:hypothetical protein
MDRASIRVRPGGVSASSVAQIRHPREAPPVPPVP